MLGRFSYSLRPSPVNFWKPGGCLVGHRQPGGYWAVFLLAIAILPAGLVALWSYPIAGVILILAAVALAIQSTIELYRIKHYESVRDT